MNFNTFIARQHSCSAYQKTSINLDVNNLVFSHILSISATIDTQLIGQIAINGRVIKEIQKPTDSVDLSTYLTKGINNIDILGVYKPLCSSVSIQFSGPSTKITQQASGNGLLRQILVITVS